MRPGVYNMDSMDESDEEEKMEKGYLISDIINGFTHLYEEKEEKGQSVCSGKIVKTKNLKEPPVELTKIKAKLCEKCVKKSEID